MNIIIQEYKEHFDIYSAADERFIYKEVALGNLKELIMGFQHNNITFIPRLENKKVELPLLLVSENMSDSLAKLLPDTILMCEISEQINCDGDITGQLFEHSINKVLRFVFQHKTKNVFIGLNNSIRNSLHERTMRNLLVGAGYHVFLSSDIL